MNYERTHNIYLSVVKNYLNDLKDICKNNKQVGDHSIKESLIYNIMTFIVPIFKKECNVPNLSELEMCALLLAGYCYYNDYI